ncbi:hypothetical protein D3C72_1903120 [compost metagenome]
MRGIHQARQPEENHGHQDDDADRARQAHPFHQGHGGVQRIRDHNRHDHGHDEFLRHLQGKQHGKHGQRGQTGAARPDVRDVGRGLGNDAGVLHGGFFIRGAIVRPGLFRRSLFG